MGVRVIFQNADSSLVLSTTTDINGVATATMGIGGFVTAIDPFVQIPPPPPTGVAPRGDVRTFAGVKPNDELVLHEENGDVSVVNVTINVPIDGNVTRYFLRTPCNGVTDITNASGSGSGSGSSPGGPVQLFGCGATTDILIEGQDGNGQTVRTLFKSNVALNEGGVIDLTADAYVNAVDATHMYTNIPARFGGLNVFGTINTTQGSIFDFFLSTDVVGGSAGLSTKAPMVIPGTLAINFTELFDNLSFHSIIEWGAATNTYALDAGNILLPEFTEFPTFDIATRTGSWMQAATGAAPDMAVLEWDFDRPSQKRSWTWEIAAPFGSASVTLPLLPADGMEFNPVTDDNVNIDSLATVKVPGGYDAIRENALTPSQSSIVVGPTGRVVVQDLQFGKAKKRTLVKNTTKRWVSQKKVRR
jgi:hypothetical protein